MILDLTPSQRDLVGRVGELARGAFAARADGYDRTATFPAEDFDDLRRAGLHAPAVPRDYGGLGLGPSGGLLALWMMTVELARADMSLARCWEGHVNAQVLLAALGDDRQKARWFEGIVARGEQWVAWSGEPPGGPGSVLRRPLAVVLQAPLWRDLPRRRQGRARLHARMRARSGACARPVRAASPGVDGAGR